VVPEVSVREHAYIVESDALVDRIVGRLPDEVLIVDLRALRRTDDHPVPHVRRKRNASSRLFHYDDCGRVSHEDIGDDGVVEPMIDRCHDGTELRGREQDLQECRMVGAKPADTVSSLYAELAEPVREAANPVRKLTVSTAPLAVDQRGLIGRDSRSPLDPGPDSPVHCHFQGSTPPTNAAIDPSAGFKLRLAQDADPVTRTERRLDPFSRASEPGAGAVHS
jgi:hypothetical protein